MATKPISIPSLAVSRYTDLEGEPVTRLLAPISGYQDEPLVPLEEAIKPIAHFFDGIEGNAWVAKQNCPSPADGLSQDMSAAIHLYTMQFGSEPSLYRELNKSLRAENRQALKPWFPFLKLFLTALHTLPSHAKNIWRGVCGVDLRSKYPTGSKFAFISFAISQRSVIGSVSIDLKEIDVYIRTTEGGVSAPARWPSKCSKTINSWESMAYGRCFLSSARMENPLPRILISKRVNKKLFWCLALISKWLINSTLRRISTLFNWKKYHHPFHWSNHHSSKHRNRSRNLPVLSFCIHSFSYLLLRFRSSTNSSCCAASPRWVEMGRNS